MAEIKVTIKDETQGNTSTNKIATPQQVVNNATPTTPQQANNFGMSKSIALAGLVANQTINYVTSNVGKWTGNTNSQIAVNDVQQLIGIGTAFFVNPVLGATNLGIQLATKVIDYSYQEKYNEITQQNKRIRAGYSSNGDVVSRRKYYGNKY